ncbi:hypothetical protein ACFOU2_22225 [Bacillus songklensis]|uniref:Uncharacterized protein n=1 Tax=Bacillus songklensis TaxID=1069116 RepID=A0ABV8B6U9_9BACI
MSQATNGKETQLKQEAAYTRIKTKIDNFDMLDDQIVQLLAGMNQNQRVK